MKSYGYLFFIIILSPLFAGAVVVQPDIKINKNITTEDIEFIYNVFKDERMSQPMECEIKVDLIEDLRQFKDKSIRIKSLELKYKSNKYSGEDEDVIIISVGDNYGYRVISHLTEGRVEEFRIDLKNNKYSSFVQFSHNGKGRITDFMWGDIYRLNPCHFRKY